MKELQCCGNCTNYRKHFNGFFYACLLTGKPVPPEAVCFEWANDGLEEDIRIKIAVSTLKWYE